MNVSIVAVNLQVNAFTKDLDLLLLDDIDFSLKLNNEIVQSGNSSEMIFSFDKIISYVSASHPGCSAGDQCGNAQMGGSAGLLKRESAMLS